MPDVERFSPSIDSEKEIYQKVKDLKKKWKQHKKRKFKDSLIIIQYWSV